MNDSDYIKPSERPKAYVADSLMETRARAWSSHAVADDIARELAEALVAMRDTRSDRFNPEAVAKTRDVLARYDKVMGEQQ